MKYLKLLLVFSLAAFVSCIKDKPQNTISPSVNIGSGQKVYIVNEGNFTNNNSSISLYNISTGQLIDDFYKTQNNNAVLGDVCQSITKANNKFYIAVNNSGKIVVVGADDFKHKATIGGLTSPRYILPVTYNKAYVSDLYNNAISVIDLNTNSKTGLIQCWGWTEQMAMIYNKAFVTNLHKNYIYVVNTVNDQIVDSVQVGINAGSITIDKNSKIWVLSSGDKTNNIPGKLTRINPVSLQIELSLIFNSNDVPANLCLSSGKDTLYYINNHVFRMDISANNLPSSAFIQSNNNTFYGMAINEKDYTIYLSDAIDYVQKSSIMIYTSQGQLKTTFKSGINTSGFYFQ